MIYAAAILLYLWAFWGMYVLVMGIYRAHLAKRLTPVTLAMSLPFVGIGYAMDVVANLIIAPVVFLERPRELLVTSRLQRHINTGIGTWRGKLAATICDNLLDVFDPTGNHC